VSHPKEPTIKVPVTVLLALVRNYKEQPQELCDKRVWLEADRLERPAYRKYLSYKKLLKDATK
jgi:hypothetical protein